MKKTICAAAAAALILTSCMSAPETIRVEQQINSEEIAGKNIAVARAHISEWVLPVFPLIDAGIFKAVVYEHYESYSEEQRSAEEAFTETLSRQLSGSFGLTAVNAGTCGDGTAFDIYEADEDGRCELAAEICRDAGTELSALLVVQPETVSVGYFGTSSGTRTVGRLYLYDRNGMLIAKAAYRQPAKNVRAGNIEDYRCVLIESEDYVTEMTEALLGKEGG